MELVRCQPLDDSPNRYSKSLFFTNNVNSKEIHIGVVSQEVRVVFFSNKEKKAFERMMQERPGTEHFDSGIDGPYPECRQCREHQPYRSDRFCRYAECPFVPGRSTIRTDSVREDEVQRNETDAGKEKTTIGGNL